MGAGAGAAAAVGGGMLGQAFFGNRAARQQARGYNDAYSRNQDLVNEAIGRLTPYSQAGTQALSPLTGLLLGKQYNPQTGQYDTINNDQRNALFMQSPGYQFRVDQAQKAIQNSQAARGNLLSGGALKELDQYTQGLASDEYGNYISQLNGLVGMGEQATSAQAGIQSNAIPGLTNLMLGGSMGGAQQSQNYSNMFGQLAGLGASALGGAGPNASANSGGFGGGLQASSLLAG